VKIKLPYLDRYRSGGKLYYYVRRKGRPSVRLDGELGTPEFMASYQVALEAAAPQRDRHAAGTFGRLVSDFYRSVDFANLKPSSKKAYRIVLDPVSVKHGHRPAANLPRSFASHMIEAIGEKRPGMANLTQAVMRRLMAYAVRGGVRSDNPFAGMAKYKGGTHHTWTDAELRTFEARWPLGTRERLAYTLLLYTGQRGGDVVRMRRQDIISGAIGIVQEKTGTALSIPIHPNLHAAMKAGPSKGMNLIGDEHGRPIGRAALTELMKRAAKAAGLPTHCLPHGLRKAVMRRLAERGGTAKELQAISGHMTLTEVERYTKQADQRVLSEAAIAKLRDETP
jgi:site-specific recombinase XerD